MNLFKEEDLLCTGEVRLSYPNLVSGETSKKADGSTLTKYTAVLLLKKDAEDAKETLDALKAFASSAAKKKFGEDCAPKIQKLKIKNGDAVDEDTGKLVSKDNVGCYVLQVSTYRKPQIVNAKKEPVGEDEMYAGCYVRATLGVRAYSFKGDNGVTSKGVTLTVGNVQKLRDGEPFGASARSADEDFDDIAPAKGSDDSDEDMFN